MHEIAAGRSRELVSSFAGAQVVLEVVVKGMCSKFFETHIKQRFKRSSKNGTAFTFPFLRQNPELVPVLVPTTKSGTSSRSRSNEGTAFSLPFLIKEKFGHFLLLFACS